MSKLLGKNGILTKVKNAELATETKAVQEEIALKLIETSIDTIGQNTDIRTVIGKNGVIVKTTSIIDGFVYDFVDISQLDMITKYGKTATAAITTKDDVKDIYMIIGTLKDTGKVDQDGNSISVLIMQEVVYVNGQGRIEGSGETPTGRTPESFSVTGVENNAFYNKPVAATIILGTATLKKDAGSETDYTSGIAITEEGEYVLKVTPADTNISPITINFEIDKTPPNIALSPDEERMNVTITDKNLDENSKQWIKGEYNTVAEYKSATGEKNKVTGNTFTVAETGYYTVYAKDRAGNEAVKTDEVYLTGKLYLFKKGDPRLDITGGWKTGPNQQANAFAQIRSDDMWLGTTSSAYCNIDFRSINIINTQDYSKLYVEVASYTIYASYSFNVGLSVDGSNWLNGAYVSFNKSGIYVCNIPNNTNAYIKLGTVAYGVSIKNIWLEK